MKSKFPNIDLEAHYAENAERQRIKAAIWRHLEFWPFVVVRILFGTGWLLAGVTKITEKAWFSEPGVFLRDYLIKAMANNDVPGFYRAFIEHAALPHVMVFNYAIPVAQIGVGLFLIAGLLTFPSILVCLFMHINFILSGNMNVISLVLYTSAFLLLLSGNRATGLSADRYFNFESILALNGGNHAQHSFNPEVAFRRSPGMKLGRWARRKYLGFKVPRRTPDPRGACT